MIQEKVQYGTSGSLLKSPQMSLQYPICNYLMIVFCSPRPNRPKNVNRIIKVPTLNKELATI